MPCRCLMVVNPACIRSQKEQLQFSVYARVCNGNNAVKKHEGRLQASLPRTALYVCLSLRKSNTSPFKFFWEIINRRTLPLPVSS